MLERALQREHAFPLDVQSGGSKHLLCLHKAKAKARTLRSWGAKDVIVSVPA